MNSHITVLSGVCLALCCCQPEESTSGPSLAEAEGEDFQSEEQVRVIADWHLAVVGAGEDASLVEWPSLTPIQPPLMKINPEWGFVIVETEHGPRVFEWPSLVPIRDTGKKLDEIDVNDLPPLPDSRWSK